MNPAKIYEYLRDPDEIVRRSFAIIAAEADLARFPADIRPVAERLIHTTGMVDAAADLTWSDGAGWRAAQALKGGADIICDVAMVAAGLSPVDLGSSQKIHIAVKHENAAELAQRCQTTRSAAGFDCMADRLGGAIVVIGNAPTALFRVLELAENRAQRPAFIFGFPVGFVGASESKEALANNDFGIPFIALTGRRGGSAIAAAAVNALLRDRNVP